MPQRVWTSAGVIPRRRPPRLRLGTSKPCCGRALDKTASARDTRLIAEEDSTSWTLTGTLLIACNCAYGCPCNFNAPPTHGNCEGGWTWHIGEGRFGEVKLDGLNLSLYADWPGAIHEGGGVAVAFVDQLGDDAQRNALTTLLRGEAGGPWEIFAGTYALSDPEPVAYELELAEHRTRLRAGDAVELEFEPMRNPVTGKEVHPGIVLPEGLVCRGMQLAASKVFRVRDGIAYDHSGNYTGFTTFEYSNA